MQKNLLTALLLSVFGLSLYAQSIVVTGTEFIKINGYNECFYPRFSPAGDYLLVTSANYAGLRSYDLANKKVTLITNDAGAGYNTQISADGKTILYSKTEFIKNLRHNSLVKVDKTSRITTKLTSPSRDALTARFSANKPTYVIARKLVKTNITANELKPIITVEDKKLVLYTASARKTITPNGLNESYIWPSISPNGKSLVYAVVGKGVFVSDLNGANVKSIGKFSAPKWLNDNWIVGMDDKDDGEKVISSELVAVKADGSNRQKIQTPSGKIAMYPAASADGSRIAFNTEAGELYILKISIK